MSWKMWGGVVLAALAGTIIAQWVLKLAGF